MLQPKWNEKFTVLVAPYSRLHIRLLDHRKDTLIGEEKKEGFIFMIFYLVIMGNWKI